MLSDFWSHLDRQAALDEMDVVPTLLPSNKAGERARELLGCFLPDLHLDPAVPGVVPLPALVPWQQVTGQRRVRFATNAIPKTMSPAISTLTIAVRGS